MSVALRARQPPSKPHHGKFIYLFSHLRTNQVIYSLEKEIHTERQERVLLKQLTFYGKKTVPAKLRKDLWQPFATVTFPRPEDGLQAFKLLKEYRMVRDYAWTFAPTEADITQAEQHDSKTTTVPADNDSGLYGLAKYSTRFDHPLSHYTFYPSKRERAQLLMDQRATSVADLAHIITRQLDPSPTHVPFAQRNADKQRHKLWAKVQAMASTSPKEIQKLEDERAEIQQTAAASVPGQLGHIEKARLKKRTKRAAEITALLNRLRKAREAVAFAAGASEQDVPEAARKKWSSTLKYIVQMQDPSRPVLSSYDRAAADAKREAELNKRPSNWPRSRKFDAPVLSGEDAAGQAPLRPKMLTSRDRIALRHAAPETDTRLDKGLSEDAVLVQWAHLPDAQYAAGWHGRVVHEPMEDRYVAKAKRTFERLTAEAEAEEAEVSGQFEDRYKAVERRSDGEEEKKETGGWLGAMNPMRLFRGGGGEART